MIKLSNCLKAALIVGSIFAIPNSFVATASAQSSSPAVSPTTSTTSSPTTSTTRKPTTQKRTTTRPKVKKTPVAPSPSSRNKK